MSATSRDPHGPVTPQELRELAVRLVRETAAVILDKREDLTKRHDIRDFTRTKSSAVDPVTIVDTLAEETIVGALGHERPADGVLGEEGSDRRSTSGITWIIDPIDGTVNFIYGLPQYAVSVAAARDGKVLAGAVINVTFGDLYSASSGGGATVERGPRGQLVELRASAATDPGEALLGTGFGYAAEIRSRQAALLARLLPQVRDVRRMGSAALDLCAVAEGRLDAYYEHGIHSWDYAAGALIAAEAGARVTAPPLSLPGAEGVPVIALAPGLVDPLGRIFADADVYSPISVR